MKKRLLLFLDFYLPHCGGVETVFEQITQRLRKKWYHITLVTSRFEKKLKYRESFDNFEIYRVWKSRWSFLVLALFTWFSLLKKEKFDLIHTSSYVWVFPASVLGMLFHKKVVVTVHEVFGRLWILYKGRFYGSLYLFLEKIFFLMPCDVYQCVSKYTMNSLRLLYGIPDNKLRVVYNWIDYDFWDSSCVTEQEIWEFKRDNSWNWRFVVLYFGHAGKSKGLDYLIDCVPQMATHDPNVLFVFNIIDSKRRNETLQRLRFLEKFWFARQIQIFEWVDKSYLRTMVASCDVVVAPSISEGFGSVHTEVIAMDKPLITTYISSLSEVVSGKTLFIQPWSSQQIFDAIVTMKEDFDSVPCPS
jgi:glycosyltransferase involved in cell wall biosynthesis